MRAKKAQHLISDNLILYLIAAVVVVAVAYFGIVHFGTVKGWVGNIFPGFNDTVVVKNGDEDKIIGDVQPVKFEGMSREEFITNLLKHHALLKVGRKTDMIVEVKLADGCEDLDPRTNPFSFDGYDYSWDAEEKKIFKREQGKELWKDDSSKWRGDDFESFDSFVGAFLDYTGEYSGEEQKFKDKILKNRLHYKTSWIEPGACSKEGAIKYYCEFFENPKEECEIVNENKICVLSKGGCGNGCFCPSDYEPGDFFRFAIGDQDWVFAIGPGDEMIKWQVQRK